VLALEDVVKRYSVGDSNSVRAVDGVSLSVGAGELIALYGPSGSGKTTLLMMVAALLRPDSGAVRVAGRDIANLNDRESARYRLLELGFVRQSFNLLPNARTVDNAALKLLGAGVGLRDARRRVTPLLERLGLGERLSHRGHQLSMGERQRVMIARALSTDPTLVLADEPTGSLDTKRGHEVLQLLSGVCRESGVAMLLVTHDPDAARFADRAHSLHDGRLVAYGPSEGDVRVSAN
jgi:putative ABC transport system ATP-binding protein